MSVLGTATQGRYEYPQWVAWFIIQYATTAPDQDSSWQFYTNLGGSTVVCDHNHDNRCLRYFIQLSFHFLKLSLETKVSLIILNVLCNYSGLLLI